MAEGIDLYGLYNKVTDWKAVRAAGIEFAWIKLSDGTAIRDDFGYVAAGRGVGIAVGGYHYAQPGDPIAQANRLVDRCAALGALDLAPALDLEDPFVPGPAAADFAVRFLRQIQARGHVPCLYGNNSMLWAILSTVRTAVPAVKVWGARYGGTLTVTADVHQYTSTGRVSGIAGDVDRNRGSILRNTTTIKENEVELTDDVKLVNWTPDAPGNANVREVNNVLALLDARVENVEAWLKPGTGELAKKLDKVAAPVIDYAQLAAALGDGFADQVADKLAQRLQS